MTDASPQPPILPPEDPQPENPKAETPQAESPMPEVSKPAAPVTPGLLARVRDILLRPAETWDAVAAEASDLRSVILGYAVPLSAIGPVCGAVGASVFGIDMLGLRYHVPWFLSLGAAAAGWLLGVVALYLMAFLVYSLAPRFGAQVSRLNAFQLVAYSSTAAWLGGVFALLPTAAWVEGLAALYSLYLAYLGLGHLAKTPANRRVPYLGVLVVCRVILALAEVFAAAQIMALGASAAPRPETHVAAKSAASSAAPAPPKIADARALFTLMPPIFNGAVRADTAVLAEGDSTAASAAEATYVVKGGSIHLRIADTAGKPAPVDATGGDNEMVTTDGNRVTRESYDVAGRTGHYALTLNNRIRVEADGSGVDLATLKALVGQVNIDKADGLTK